MPAFGPRSMLASSAIGFVLGITLTALFVAGSRPSHRTVPPTPVVPTVVPVSADDIRSRVSTLAQGALGFAPNTGRSRIEGVYVSTASTPLSELRGLPQLFDTTIVFHLNGNPFGPSQQVKSARADAFALLKALYVHSLPLNDVRLEGMFKLPKQEHEVIALRAGSNVAIQNSLAPWKKLVRSDERLVWAALRPHFISSAFQKYKYTKG